MKYAVDLVAQANDFDPIIGREEEINTVLKTLSRRIKNSVVLIGQPGVGKTAIVEAIAKRIGSGQVPKNLQNVKLMALDMGKLQAGVQRSGDAEQRLGSILTEVKAAKGTIILFVDNIHLMLGAKGKGGGSLDAANLFKPMLARGEVSCIGTTTLAEYKEFVEKDAAFERRFRQVHVAEPSISDTISILRGLKAKFEQNHGVQIVDQALVAAVQLSSRYITNYCLPDKAIDVLDDACVSVRFQLEGQPEVMVNLVSRIRQLEGEASRLEDEGEIASNAVRKELDGLKDKQRDLKMKYRQERERVSELRHQKQKQKELSSVLRKAEEMYDSARAIEERHREMASNMEDGSAEFAELVRFWDGEYKAIKAGSVEISEELKNKAKKVNSLRKKIGPQMLRKQKARTEAFNQFKEEVVSYLLELKNVKRKELDVARGLQSQRFSEAQDARLEGNAGGDLILSDTVGPEHVAEVVSSWTGIPISRLGQNEKQRLLRLAERLHERVVGQNRAVDAVAECIMRSRVELGKRGQPIGSFLFLGPTGVGKTELAKAIALQLFDDENLIIRMDMSEYMEAHSVARLIGSPPGYVGHEQGGQLTEAVRRKPYSVVLLDELEKAHVTVSQPLLQVLDDGRLTDGHGLTVDFSNTVIIMTSNLGAKHLLDGLDGKCSMEAAREQVEQEVEGHFPPEFLNRIGKMIVFDPLSHDQLKEVAGLLMNDVIRRMAEKGIAVAFSNAALDFVLARSYKPAYGARPISRWVENELVTKLARMLVREEIHEGSTVHIDARSDAQDLLYHVGESEHLSAAAGSRSAEEGRIEPA